MPELPEVETVLRRIRPRLLGQRIEQVEFRRASRLLRDTVSAPELARHLRGARVQEVRRRGKYLVLNLDCGHDLVLHLGMTGKLVEVPPGCNQSHAHARFCFDGFDLLFCDPRTFGRIVLLPGGDTEALPGLASIGPEPLGKDFTSACLLKALHQRQAPIKALLMDQRIIAGLGNIYVDEALFRAGIHPLRPGGSLSLAELKRLRRAIRAVLREAIRFCGTTIINYEWAAGRKGSFQNKLRIYGRAGEPCRACGRRIASARVAGRTTCFCPHCQPRRRK
jgi:formamidopyrimidine-DNA glycosylase